jgi:hypothetical protein
MVTRRPVSWWVRCLDHGKKGGLDLGRLEALIRVDWRPESGQRYNLDLGRIEYWFRSKRRHGSG